MARVELAPEVIADLERTLEHLEHPGVDGQRQLDGILVALDALEHNPEIGRPCGTARELVIGRRARGFVALYRYIEPLDLVLVLAVRSQREAGASRLP